MTSNSAQINASNNNMLSLQANNSTGNNLQISKFLNQVAPQNAVNSRQHSTNIVGSLTDGGVVGAAGRILNQNSKHRANISDITMNQVTGNNNNHLTGQNQAAVVDYNNIGGINTMNYGVNPRYGNNSAINNYSSSHDQDKIQNARDLSPSSNELYKSKSKLNSIGRKPQHVSQSAGFKQLKHIVNKSLDSTQAAQDMLRGTNMNPITNANPTNTSYMNGLIQLSTSTAANLSQQVIKQQQNISISPKNFSIKLNNMAGSSAAANYNSANIQNTTNSIISQFQTIQSVQQALNLKRNQTLQGQNSLNRRQGGSIDTKKQQLVRPSSKAGRLNDYNNTTAKGNEQPNSRGSRFITSNNKRLTSLDENTNGTIENSRNVNSSFHDYNSLINLTTQNNNNNLNQSDSSNPQNNNIMNTTNTSFKSNNPRPKTSMGYQSFLDKFNTSTTATSTLPENDSKDLPSNLQEELENITLSKKEHSYQHQQLPSSQALQKPFIIKKGDRNEGLRSYLRKSLDSSSNHRKLSDQSVNVIGNSNSQQSQLNQTQLNTTTNVTSNDSQIRLTNQISKPKRKRDYSKVIAGQSFLTIQQQQQIASQQINPSQIVSLSPQFKNQQGHLKKNLYQESFHLMNEQKQNLIVSLNQASNTANNNSGSQTGANSINKTSAHEDGNNLTQIEKFNMSKQTQPSQETNTGSKTNSRSQTSHKLNRSGQVFNGPGVSLLKSQNQPITNKSNSIEDKNITIDHNPEEESRKLKSRSEERPSSQSRYKANNFHNLRASINQEVTTQAPVDSKQKVDNCVSKFAFATKTGFSPSNPYKVNQDSFLAMPHLGEYRRTHFFSVCDGHGVYGKEVSEFIKQQLGMKVEGEIKIIFDNAKQLQRVVDSNEVKDALALSFAHVTQQLYTNSGIEIYFSGSTCVSVLIVGNKVFCANVGDSRAVLARDVDGHISGFPLNRDHKASEPDEEKRILNAGGRIESFKDPSGRQLGPLRVWHMHENIPGLAMSRSFGDHAAAEVGVIAEPEILEMNLIEDDKFIVIASDGVWEFLSNDEVVRIIYPHYKNNSAEKAAEALIRESLKRWKQEENVVDDITCIIIFLSIQ